MMVNDILEKVREKICAEVSVEKEAENLYRIETPFTFDDGDLYIVYLERKVEGYFLTDRAHTLMHISYWTDVNKFFEGRRNKIFEAILNRFGLAYEDGEIKLRTSLDDIGESVYRFLQALDKVTDMEYLDREQIRTMFVEDVIDFTTNNLGSFRPQQDWFYKEKDPEGKYKAHIAMRNNGKLVLVFALASDETTRDATISLYYLTKTKLDFTSIGIFKEQETINRKVLARFTDVCERQLSSFSSDNQSRYVEIVEKILS